MRFVPIGVGDAFTELSYGSSIVVVAGGAKLLVDFPDPPRKALREAARASGVDLRVETIDAAVLTHLHGDHVNGLEGVAFFRRFAEGRRLKLAAGPAVLRELWGGRLRVAMGRLTTPEGRRLRLGMADYLDTVPLREGRRTRVGPFAIEVRRTRHPVPTYALRIECGGRRLSMSADTAFEPELIAWLAEDAHVIVHETNLGIHTPYEKLLTLPADIRRRMRLIHYPDGFDRTRRAIECLRVGRVYRV